MSTVFVIGAGASCEFRGLMSGNELKAKIREAVDFQVDDVGQRQAGESEIAGALQLLAQQEGFVRLGHHAGAAKLIVDGLPPARSIDNFLHSHSSSARVVAVGKLAIAHCILKAERDSDLYYDVRETSLLDLGRVQSTWISWLFGLLTEGVDRVGIAARLAQTTFIIFNYDRCVEHYLIHALREFFDFQESEAQQVLSRCKIYHPYGKTGELALGDGSRQGASFGAHPTGHGLLQIAQQLRTFTEGADSSEIEGIRQAIRGAERLVFLGFAFHPINMKLLEPAYMGRGSPRIYATGKGLSESDVELIKSDLLRMIAEDTSPTIARETSCVKLFQEYGRSLSFEV